MTDLERIKKDVVEMDSRANVCWYDTKVLTKAVRLILEELTADRKTEPQTDLAQALAEGKESILSLATKGKMAKRTERSGDENA